MPEIRRLLVWNKLDNCARFATPEDASSGDAMVCMDINRAIELFEQRVPDRTTRFTQRELSQLMGASFSTFRQFLDYRMLPIAGEKAGKERLFDWREGLLTTLVGSFWRQNVPKDGLRTIGEFLAEHIEELEPAAVAG